jgi:hypothetical protein
MTVNIGPGWQVGSGWTLGSGGGSPPAGTGAITYAQMPPPVVAGQQLQDVTATINDPVGFTINNSSTTGVAVTGLTANNITYFNTLGTGTHTATLGAGSTYGTISVNVTNIPSDGGLGQLVWFFDQAVSYPATFNYPITIS